MDDTPWRWADASGEPLIINGLPAAGELKEILDVLEAEGLRGQNAPIGELLAIAAKRGNTRAAEMLGSLPPRPLSLRIRNREGQKGRISRPCPSGHAGCRSAVDARARS